MALGFRAHIRIAQNNLPVMKRKLTPAVAKAMRVGMANYLVVADRLVPVDQGFLRANKTIIAPTAGMGGNPVGFIGYNQHYAGYVHEGTYRTKANPWARKAADVIKDDYSRSVAAAITEGLS